MKRAPEVLLEGVVNGLLEGCGAARDGHELRAENAHLKSQCELSKGSDEPW